MSRKRNDELKQCAKNLLNAIEQNFEDCEEYGISDTGSFTRQQYIAEEIEQLESALKLETWYEIFIDLEDEGTETVGNRETLREARQRRLEIIKEREISRDKIHIDKWRDAEIIESYV